MSRTKGTVVRVGTDGWTAARDLYRRVRAAGWGAVGIAEADAPDKITMGSVTAAVLRHAARS